MADEVREPRVYTDERFPALKVVNQGDVDFMVYEDGIAIDSFVAYERRGVKLTSEPFAQRRAVAYFEHMAKGQMGDELASREDDVAEPVPIKNLANRLNWQPKERGVNPLAGMREMTPQDIDSVVAQARAEQDPVKREALFKQAGSMMAQQESTAQRVVRTLLDVL